MRVLVACEESQAVTIAFREQGHQAFSCDIQECSGGHPEWHYKADVFDVIDLGWDMMIAHPPCTYLSNVGNGYFNLKKHQSAVVRWQKRMGAAEFFLKLYNAPIDKICIENPVGFINSILPPTQTIHPYFFGDAHKKRTCLWLKNLPPLFHSEKEDLFTSKTHVFAAPIYIDKSGKPRYFVDSITGGRSTTQKERSKTFPGIAKAMAIQWGGVIINLLRKLYHKMQKPTHKAAYELAKIYSILRNTKVHAEVLMNEKEISGGTKHWIKTSIINRVNAIETDLIGILPPADYQIMKDDLLQDETALQIQAITDMLLAMPKGIRDECESYIEARHNVYGQFTKAS